MIIKGGSALSRNQYYVRDSIFMLVAVVMLVFSVNVFAGNSVIRFNEVMTGLNGDSSIQFIEVVARDNQELSWGPSTSGEPGRAMLVFYNANGEETSRYIIPDNPRGSVDNPDTIGNESNTILFATQGFVDLLNASVDFVIPPVVPANNGKICFRDNPDNSQDVIDLCISYGGKNYFGDTESVDAANQNVLSIMDSSSLSRNNLNDATFGQNGHLNADFILSTPTPSSSQATINLSNTALEFASNSVGETSMPTALSMVEQGKNLFFKETFNGNGRTCDNCHKEDEKFGLTAEKINSLSPDDPLFRNEQNINTLIVSSEDSMGSLTLEMAKPSDYQVGDTITGTLGGSAKILAVETVFSPAIQKHYLVIDGRSLDIPDNVISDSAGNSGLLVSFQEGDLNGPNPVHGTTSGLEISAFLRGDRALIVENIDGFTEREVLRGSPSLMNLKFTAPYGLSAEFPDLQSFSAGAIAQHFPRRMKREAGVDFRVAISEELKALTVFQESLVSVSDENFDDLNLFERFITTDQQRRGRDLFFGEGLCVACHFGTVLAGTFDGDPGIRALDTGVARLQINRDQGLPTEESIGSPENSRAFSVPTLFDLGETAPFFHDNSVATLADAIAFYSSDAFAASREGQIFGAIRAVGIPENVSAIESFLLALTEPPPVGLTPDSVDFFNTAIGESSHSSVTISNLGDEPLSINSFQFGGTDKSDFQLAYPDQIARTLLPGESYDIDIVYTATSIGDKQARLELNAMFGEKEFKFNIPLNGSQGAPEIVIATEEISFGSVDINSVLPVIQLVEISNSLTAGAPLKIRDLKLVGSDADQFQLLPGFNQPQLRPGESQFIVVSFEPTSVGEKEVELMIISNDPESPEEEAELTGNVVNGNLPGPAINVNFMEVDFGSQDVDAGQILTRTIEIKNEVIAGAVLEIHELKLSGDDADNFVLLNRMDRTTLQPGESLFVTVAFDPKSLGEKEAKFKIKSNDRKNAKVKVELEGEAIDQKLADIFIRPTELTVRQGEVANFTALGSFSDGTVRELSFERNINIFFEVGNPELAFGFGGGNIFAINAGTTTVTATANGIASDPATLIITPPPAIVSFEITPLEISTEVGEIVFLAAMGLLEDGTTENVTDRLTWSSSDPNVARVEFSGFLLALNPGVTTITAVSQTGVREKAPATVTVNTPPAIIEFDITPLSVNLPLGQAIIFTAFGLTEDGIFRDVTRLVNWQSSNENVATAEQGGFVIATGVGVATITAVSHNGVSANAPATLQVFELTLPSPIVEFDIIPGDTEISLGDDVGYFATGLLEDGSLQDVTRFVQWSSSDSTVAVIDRGGFAISLSPGTTTISATTESGIKANKDSLLTVVDGPVVSPPRADQPIL